MRILADENLLFDIILRLQQGKHEVMLVSDVGLAGREDLKILEYVEKENLIWHILEVLDCEAGVFKMEKSVVVVVSKGGYRIHKVRNLTK